MCVHPLNIPNTSFKHPLHGVVLDRLSPELRSLIRDYQSKVFQVPCGKCIDCLKSRQNDLATRVYLAANQLGSFGFLTLTYNELNLPYMATLCMVDKHSGEVFNDFHSKFVSRSSPLFSRLVKYFQSTSPNFKPRYFDVHDITSSGLPFHDSDFDYFVRVTPSLDRRDIQLWFKQCRVIYKRKFGDSLPDFKYVVVGEYGPNTCRPHYHVCLLGLSREQLHFMASVWSCRYGFTDLRFVSPINKDGKSGFLAAAKYCAKYICKGRFECDSVKDKFAQSPRLMTSINLVSLSDNIIEYYRAYDLFGSYSINNCGSSGVSFSLPSLQKLHEEVVKRAHVDLNGFQYKLPKSLLKKLWYVKESSGVYRPSSLRMCFTAFTQSNLLDSTLQKCKDCGVSEQVRQSVFEAFVDEQNGSKILSESTEHLREQSYQKQFYMSKF